MEDKDFMDAIHLEIHAVRRLPVYKPTQMEKNISRFVIEKFTKCKECQEVKAKLLSSPVQNGGLLKKIGDVIKNV